MNKDHRSIFETNTTSRFLSALRSLDAEELPELKEAKLSRAQKNRIHALTRERMDAYRHPKTSQAPDLHEDAVEYSPALARTLARRSTWSTVAACLVLCIGLVAGGVYFREDISTFLTKPAYFGEPGTDVTVPPTTEALGSDIDPAIENTQFTLDLAAITYGGTDTAMVLTLIPTETAPEAAVIEVGRYALSLWDDEAFPNRWRTKIDHAPDPHLTFTKENGFETMLVLDGHRIDENEKWLWQLELFDITVMDANRNEIKLDGYVSMQFNTGGDSVVTLPEIPESECVPEDASETMDLAVAYTALGGNTVEVDFSIIPRPGTEQNLGFALYYATRILEKWEDGAWVTVSSEDRLYDPLPAIMAGEIDFAVCHANGLSTLGQSTLGQTTLTYDLDPGVYRLTLRGITSIREAAEGETAEMFDSIAEEIESGSVSGMFAISTK